MIRKERTPLTIRFYLKDIQQFLQFLHANKLTIQQCLDKHVLTWARQLGNINKASTINRKVVAVRSYLKWSFNNGIIPVEIKAKKAFTKTDMPPRQVIKQSALDKFFDSLDPNNVLHARDIAIFSLLLLGIKQKTILDSRVSDVDFKEQTIRTKDGDIIPIGKIALKIKAFQKLQQARLPRYKDINSDASLFPNRHGQQMTARSVRRKLQTYATKLGMGIISPSTLRYTFVAKQLAAGVLLIDIQKSLGHKSVSTTKICADLLTTNEG